MIRTISMKQLEAYFDSGREFTLLDVREPEQFREGHLEGAVNIPLEELEQRAHELSARAPVVIYCEHGSRSLLAAQILDSLGIAAVSAVGGLVYYRGRHFVVGDGRRSSDR